MKSKNIVCAQCGHRITLQLYAGRVTTSRAAEAIKCPECGTERVYSGDDFVETTEAHSCA